MTDLTTIDNALGDDMRIIGSLVVVLCILAVAGTPASEALQDDAAAEFAGKCAMCHGKAGAGDGAASAAMNPKPPDFTAAEYQESRSDEEIAEAIKTGKGMMPAYGEKLSAEAIDGLVAYIRTLGSE
jgi:mono/diheme cytochrome c family protein